MVVKWRYGRIRQDPPSSNASSTDLDVVDVPASFIEEVIVV